MGVWDVRPMDEVTFIQEGPGIRKYEYQEGGYPMINVRCVQNGYIDMTSARAANMDLALGKWAHFQIDVGDILFTISGTIGRCAIVRESDLPIIMNTSVVRFKPIDPSLETRFLYYFLQSEGFQGPLKELSSGAAIQNVGPTHIKTLSIPFPPAEEQRRIVAVLDQAFAALDRARAHAEANLADANHLKGRGADQLLRRIAANSPTRLLGELADFRNGLNFSRHSNGETVKVAGVGDFQRNFWLPIENLKTISIEGRLSEMDRLYAGDILAVRSNGNKDLIGRVMLVGETEEDLSFSGFVIRIRALSTDVDPEYLCHFMKSKAAVAHLLAGGGGANISNLNQGILSSLPVAVPSTAKQREFASSMNNLNAKIELLVEQAEAKIFDLANLRQSLLQKAFSGQLT